MNDNRVQLDVNGEQVLAEPGITVAAALLNAGRTAFRISVTGQPRAPLCGMGICYECRVTIDGIDQQRACMRVVVDGMRIETVRHDG